ncbi:MAG: carbon monoxide dehydrogenase subunit G [Pseudomonadota bacterium]
MELQDEIFIEAPRDLVFAALNDPDILKQCIPGCEELTKESDTELTAKVVLRIGPVKASFGGKVTLDPSEAPDRFSLSGEGSGGVAGYAKGGADVELVEQDGGTLLRYAAKADIGGKLAQLGSRLVTSTAKKLSKNFFEAFKAVLVGDGDDVAEDKKGTWASLIGR